MADASVPKSMRAWRYASVSKGIEHAIELKDGALPPLALAKDMILVKVAAAALNPADHKVPEMPAVIARRILPVPAIPGMDFAGTVAHLGAGVTGFTVGQRVFGRVQPGSWGTLAEYIAVNREGVAGLPESVSFEQGASFGTAALTSYQLIVPNVSAGDKVFINGGSGGTGTFGIQIAKALGCYVVTSCSGANVELCKSLGADLVIDYTKEDVSAVLKAQGQVFKLVADNVGSAPLDLYKAADVYLKPEGKFLQIGGEMAFSALKNTVSRMMLPGILGGGKRKFEMPMTANKHDQLVQLAVWAEEGKVKGVVEEVFEFDKAPQAFLKLKTGRVKGKIVVRVT